ncbi:MAG: toll/interleukin-1 receptor domain-containing protein [Anaerolineales bacterium]|nr:toll/interleukin-1 receptor domain-containing protein [Anaerolineales bacterium]
MQKIFISYSRKDIDFVRKLAGDLENAGFDVWWDLTDLHGGDDWPRTIPAAIKASNYVIIVISPNSTASNWVEKEYTHALSLRKKIIPVMLERSNLPFALNTINFVDFTNKNYAANFDRLLSGLGFSGGEAAREVALSTRPTSRVREILKRLGEIFKTDSSARMEEEVHFTALHAKGGKVEAWQTLLVYVHTAAALDQVRADAKRLADEIQTPREVSTPASSGLKRGTEITIVPTCEGVTFNPRRASIRWLEDFHKAEFRYRADQTLQGDAAKGQITFYVGPLIVGTLKFAMLFESGEKSTSIDHEEHSKMYHQDKIFISYSHKDTEIALAFKKVHEATGHDVLIDIDDLRSGEEWNPALMHLIDRADIFQLFWSENSKSSKFCKQEWEHALKRRQAGFIRPVYWSLPMPNPPEELRKYHFEYVEL